LKTFFQYSIPFRGYGLITLIMEKLHPLPKHKAMLVRQFWFASAMVV